MIRTKIVATLGPASSEPDMLLQLFKAGVDVCRLNFSHGQLSEHLHLLQNIRSAAGHCDEPIAVLGDLSGPKIRLGQIADEGGTGGMSIAPGDTLHIQRESIVGGHGRVSTTYQHFVDDIRAGDRVLIEDGMLRFLVTEKSEDEVTCACTVGGVLKTAKGINLPTTPIRIPSITDKDWLCVNWAIENGLDYLALSFVRRADELMALRKYLDQHNSPIRVIAKIEKAEAVRDIDAILEASDGLMIARGDLGVEVDVAQVPIIQKNLIRRCQLAGKPVIVATQMLQSMIEQASPTRAEVSDVANAVFDGTDAIMLSGETSVGKYPVAAVHVMNHVAQVTEDYQDGATTSEPAVHDKEEPFSAAIAAGLWHIVRDLKVKLVVVWSHSGATARIFSKYRFSVPVAAFSDDAVVLRQLALHFGVLGRKMSPPADTDALIAQVDRLVIEQGLAAPSDRIVIVAGSSMGLPGTMNQVVVHTLGRIA